MDAALGESVRLSADAMSLLIAFLVFCALTAISEWPDAEDE